MTNEVARRLAYRPRILEPAMQILDGKVYIYQFKINAKAAFAGDVWEWHQDYIFWRNEGGMPTPRVVNAVIFLDEVNEFNGPLIFIPGSHKDGVIGVAAREAHPSSYQTSPEWITNFTASLKYFLQKEVLATLVEKYGMVAKGPAGSVLFFHGNIVHGSATNMSPFDRKIVIVTFNHIKNVPVPTGKKPRPEFLANRDCTPAEPLADTALLS